MFFGGFGDGSQVFSQRLGRFAGAHSIGEGLCLRAEAVNTEIDQQVLGFGENDFFVEFETIFVTLFLRGESGRLVAFQRDETALQQVLDLVEDLVFLKDGPIEYLLDGVRLLQAD